MQTWAVFIRHEWIESSKRFFYGIFILKRLHVENEKCSGSHLKKSLHCRVEGIILLGWICNHFLLFTPLSCLGLNICPDNKMATGRVAQFLPRGPSDGLTHPKILDAYLCLTHRPSSTPWRRLCPTHLQPWFIWTSNPLLIVDPVPDQLRQTCAGPELYWAHSVNSSNCPKAH